MIRLLVFCALLAPWPAHAATKAAAIFDFELIDTSTEGAYDGIRADQTERLRLMTATLKRLLVERDIYRIADLAPAAAAIRDAGRLETCNRCAERIARQVGADVAIYSYVQKVSNLILNLNVRVTDAQSGALLREASVDIRGNNEESWSRGLNYLMARDFATAP